MKYHVFTNIFNYGYLTVGDSCIYCKINAQQLYDKLSENNQKKYPFNNFKDEVIFLSKCLPCENGITEEELAIKNILE